MKKPLLLALLATVIGAGCFFSLVHFGVFWSPTVVTTVTCRNASPPPESVDLGIQPHNDCTPSFTEQDVRAYFRPRFGMHGMQVNNITFTRILFTTGADARRLMDSD